MKKFYMVIASRYMYNEYREYDRYIIANDSLENARKYAESIVEKWNKEDNSTNYELFDLWESDK